VKRQRGPVGEDLRDHRAALTRGDGAGESAAPKTREAFAVEIEDPHEDSLVV